MTATAKKTTDPRRKALLAKVHVAKAQLRLDDETYREIVARHGKGARSSAELSVGQLIDLVQELKAEGWKDKGRAPKRAGKLRPVVNDVQAKVRAAWIAAYWLGVVQDASEEALGAFVKRQAKVEALQWLKAEQAPAVIEALKAMMARSAGVVWQPYRFFGMPPQHAPKARVIEAMWRLLNEAGVIHRGDHDALAGWLELAGIRVAREAGALAHVFLEEPEADRAIIALGKLVRKARGHG